MVHLCIIYLYQRDCIYSLYFIVYQGLYQRFVDIFMWVIVCHTYRVVLHMYIISNMRTYYDILYWLSISHQHLLIKFLVLSRFLISLCIVPSRVSSSGRSASFSNSIGLVQTTKKMSNTLSSVTMVQKLIKKGVISWLGQEGEQKGKNYF